jgi:hypothetical protein
MKRGRLCVDEPADLVLVVPDIEVAVRLRYPSARQWARPITVPIVHYLDWLATALLRRHSVGGVVVPPATGNGTLLAFVKA